MERNLLDILRERGFVDQVTEPEEEVRGLLDSPSTAYIGFDPTAASLHVGSLVPIMALRQMQEAGHRPIVLVGGGTGLVGDPSGKTELRRVMSAGEVRGNAEAIGVQLARFIDFGEGKAVVVNNADWLSPLRYLDFLRDIGRQFSVNRMLSAEAYRTRYESQEGLNFLEFNYMLLQAYDYLHLHRSSGCRLQMGGSDQWGNILAGCDLVRRLEGASAYGITFPLITTASGAKMGKTADGAVWLDPARTSPYDYYQFWINTDDRDVERFLGLFTLLDMEEVRRLGRMEGEAIRSAKQILALEATRLAHGREAAQKAADASARLFGAVNAERGVPEDAPATTIPSAEFEGGIEAFDLFHRVGLARSRGAARRLIDGGGAYVNGRPVQAFNDTVTAAEAREGVITLRAGKKKHHLVRVVPGEELMSRSRVVAAALLCTLLPLPAAAAGGAAKATHALAMHGNPKYGPDFEHFDYVNPDAPKGGEVRLHDIGTFDTLNGFNLKGVAATGLGNIYDSLLTGSEDEAFTEYGLLAESVEMPEDRSSATFRLRKEAMWHDGRPVTAGDVIFTLETLKTTGHPFYRAYYANVAKAESVGERAVRFTFAGGENRELPLIIGQMPILPKHYWEERDFTKTTLDAPLGSGPYRVEKIDPGRSLTYARVEDYWGRDLPVNRGRHNFDRIRYDYYRDATVALEAFKGGEYDFRQENVSKQWATGYDVPAVKSGRIHKEEIRHERPTGMQAFVYNTRRPLFRERGVRRALAYAFDFEWTNRNLFYGQYTRTSSYFSNSELASRGLPGPEELKILDPFRGRTAEEVFTEEYRPPETDGTGRIRKNLGRAMELLKKAGWEIRDGRLTHRKTGERFAFEILLNSPTWERISLPFKKNLERLGIVAKVRTVDAAQYQKRIEEFDFDMVVDVFGQSLSPGNEQRDFWSSRSAAETGSRNTIGVRDPVVDELIDLVISAPDRESLIHRTRALDRVLLWGHYLIPHWHIRSYRVAYWDIFGRPRIVPRYALGFSSWWVDAAEAGKGEGK